MVCTQSAAPQMRCEQQTIGEWWHSKQIEYNEHTYLWAKPDDHSSVGFREDKACQDVSRQHLFKVVRRVLQLVVHACEKALSISQS